MDGRWAQMQLSSSWSGKASFQRGSHDPGGPLAEGRARAKALRLSGFQEASGTGVSGQERWEDMPLGHRGHCLPF